MMSLRSIRASDVLSFIALLVSILSIYFSIFFKNHDLTVSLIDSTVEYDGGAISTNLLYHNRGNTYSTIIQDYIIFYQTNDWENEGVIFEKDKQIYKLDYNPIVLTPGEQVLREIKIDVDFTKIDTTFRKLDLNNEIKIGLVTTYINDNGLRTSDMFPIGYIKLGTNKRIIKYKLEYDVFSLDGDHYYQSTSIE